jgi:hypothetical protein
MAEMVTAGQFLRSDFWPCLHRHARESRASDDGEDIDELKKATANYNERLAIIETTCKLRAECEMAQALAIVERQRYED